MRSITNNKNFVWAFVLSLAVTLMPEMAFAGYSAFEEGLCKVLECFFSDTVVGMIATVAIIFLGIGAFFGKVNWGLVIITVVGIVILVGAGEIAFIFAGANCDALSVTC